MEDHRGQEVKRGYEPNITTEGGHRLSPRPPRTHSIYGRTTSTEQ